jgi:hypothetical protein
LKEIQSLISRHFHTGAEAKWTSMRTAKVELTASTQYFTLLADEPSAVHVAFHSSIDPYGDLQQFAGTTMVHTSENQVEYCKKKPGLDTRLNPFCLHSASSDLIAAHLHTKGLFLAISVLAT